MTLDTHLANPDKMNSKIKMIANLKNIPELAIFKAINI